jgi:hypothetical protein
MRFFELLDDQIYSIRAEHGCVSCSGNYAASTTILRQLGFDEDAIAEITQVLASRGGVCDCEILFNVAEESRLRAEYWKSRARGYSSSDFHFRHPTV